MSTIVQPPLTPLQDFDRRHHLDTAVRFGGDLYFETGAVRSANRHATAVVLREPESFTDIERLQNRIQHHSKMAERSAAAHTEARKRVASEFVTVVGDKVCLETSRLFRQTQDQFEHWKRLHAEAVAELHNLPINVLIRERQARRGANIESILTPEPAGDE
ncbi:hypothetical protein Pan44_02570 [Caulifigura coniformis]|uniref:Uncharacterized protein n=1 Tax=Caulifigura coniformis TaxID=2527983 RepID=A0A517S7Y3_9PLAN|nr:hypothetical protein [Caulifigura coniformis]QDT52248.1 hypothetical protein Pan44_02570 [Caulifigura coniformis]